jgi:hypothetical protein
VGGSAAVLSAACLHYCAYEYVPYHAFRFADLGVLLPLPARWALFISNWYVRLLPFAILTSLLLLAPFVPVVMRMILARGAPRCLGPTIGIGCMGLAAGAAALCAVMLYGIHTGYLAVGG